VRKKFLEKSNILPNLPAPAVAKLFVDFTTYVVSTLKSQHDDELSMLSDMQNRLGDLSKTFQNNLTSGLFKWKRMMTKD
jgi:hypothetical protein